MSATSINNILGIDGRIDVNSRKYKTNVIVQGPSASTYIRTTQNSISNSSAAFTYTTPGNKTYFPRIQYLQLQGTSTFFGASAGVGIPFLQANGLPHAAGVPVGNLPYFAPRCDPVNNIIIQLQANINNYPIIKPSN